jgi:uncharacterized membrane protein
VRDNVVVTAPEPGLRRDVSQVAAHRMGALLIGSGLGHFAVPARFDTMVPAELPGDVRCYTKVSGVAEVVIGALLLMPRTRRFSALAAMVFFLLVTPVMINGVRLSRGRGLPTLLVAIVRVLLQLPMITEAFKIRRNA